MSRPQKASSKSSSYSARWRAPRPKKKKKNTGQLRIKGYGNYKWRGKKK